MAMYHLDSSNIREWSPADSWQDPWNNTEPMPRPAEQFELQDGDELDQRMSNSQNTGASKKHIYVDGDTIGARGMLATLLLLNGSHNLCRLATRGGR
jgi:hypothetical protein